MRLKMFNKDNTVKHIGNGFTKNKTLGHLRDVEKYYVKKAIKLKMDYSVIVGEFGMRVLLLGTGKLFRVVLIKMEHISWVV